MTKYSHADKMDGNTADGAVMIVKHGDEENSTDKDCFRERAVGVRLLQKLFGTGLGALREERSVTPAITVGEENAYALIRVAPPSFRSLRDGSSAVFARMSRARRRQIQNACSHAGMDLMAYGEQREQGMRSITSLLMRV